MTNVTGGKYKKNLVTYIDILGFAGQIEKSRNDEPTVRKIASLLEEIKTQASLGPVGTSTSEKLAFRTFKFSDLLVRATELGESFEIAHLVDLELLSLSMLQFSFAKKDVLIRGGVCVGDLFVSQDSTIVFGPALVKAYRLESEYAVYPRIVIDRDLHAKLDPPKQKKMSWPEFVARGEDGAYFLDYLFGQSLYTSPAAILGAHPTPQPGLEAHMGMILRGVKQIQENPDTSERVKQKFMWLALYHNRTITRLQERFEPVLQTLYDEISKFRIPDHFLNF
jgi:hypothetical protein